MLKRPRATELKTYLVFSTIATILFVLIYTYTNARADAVSMKYHFYFEWEKAIPLWPGFILIYMSLNLLTVIPLFTLDVNELSFLGFEFIFTTLVAGLVFYFFPAPVVFERFNMESVWRPLFETIYSLDRINNSLPSLHIVYSYLTIRAVSRHGGGLFLWGWFVLICLSVLLTHQHHIMDIVSGIILAEVTGRLFKLPKIRIAIDRVSKFCE